MITPARNPMKKPARKPTRKRRAAETSGGLVQIRRPIDLRLKFSPSGARAARRLLEAATTDRFSSTQLRLDARDLNSIYIYLGPTQAKRLAARLAALELP